MSTEGVTRGKFRLEGGGAHLLFLGFGAASYNIRIARKLFEEIEGNTGIWPENDNPLYQRDPEHHGFAHLEHEEAAEIDRRWFLGDLGKGDEA